MTQLRRAEGRINELGPLEHDTFRLLTSGTYIETDALLAVRCWASDPDAPPFLFLFGGVGCGKTLAALWWLSDGLGSRVDYVDVVRSGRARDVDLTVTMFEVSEALVLRRRARFESVLTERRLVIDTLDHQACNGEMRSTLLDVVNARAGLRTIIIANTPRAQLLEAYATEPRLASRLRTHARFVEVGSEDLRQPIEVAP